MSVPVGFGRRVRAGSAVLALLAGGCSDEPAGTTDEPSIFASGADQVMVGVEQYLTRDGIRRGVLHADTAFTYEDSSRIDLRNLEIQFFDESGADRGVLTSAAGTYRLETGDMTVHGSVDLRGRLEGREPSVLETDSLAYEAAENLLTTDASWTLTHPDGTVERGRGLVTDPGLQDIRTSDWTVTTPDVEVPE